MPAQTLDVQLEPAGPGVGTGTRGRAADAAVAERVARAGIPVVDLQFSDITGGTKALTIPVGVLPSVLAHGYRFDGSSLTGGVRQAELDLYLVPDPTTLAVFPAEGQGHGRARLACSVRRRDGQAFAGDPRSTLERVLEAAAAEGYDYRVGLEMEYYLLRAPVDAGGVLPHPDHAGYFDVGEDLIAGTRDEIVATLQAVGVGVGGAHHETGPGQEELDLLPTGGIRMADQVMTTRQVIRSVAQRRGLRATFMPKPLSDAPGSGMHLFQRLARYPMGGDLLRPSDEAPGEGDGLSPTARRFIAGQLGHAAGMCAVVAPTVNSYKRLAAGHRAPRHARWARVGEASLLRVPAVGTDEPAALELRSPDPMANPYLALAVAVACALDGVRRAEDPPDPLDESLVAYDDAELERLGVPRLPLTLGDALAAMVEDDVVRGALGDYIFDQLLDVKRAEWDDYRRHVSPWEHARYGDA
jgi:glutamine synthetase